MWIAVDLAVSNATDHLVAVDEVLELDLFPRGFPFDDKPWSLTPHRCRATVQA